MSTSVILGSCKIHSGLYCGSSEEQNFYNTRASLEELIPEKSDAGCTTGYLVTIILVCCLLYNLYLSHIDGVKDKKNIS